MQFSLIRCAAILRRICLLEQRTCVVYYESPLILPMTVQEALYYQSDL